HLPTLGKPGALRPSRRAFMLTSGAAIGAGLLMHPLDRRALAQRRGPAQVPVEELMKPGDLPDLVLGNPDAKITIVEYASMTCPHCANFNNRVLPELKKKYIDTGQARLVFREFPLDDLAAAGSMLARCAGDKALPMVDVLFVKREEWVTRNDTVSKHFENVKQAGNTKERLIK